MRKSNFQKCGDDRQPTIEKDKVKDDKQKYNINIIESNEKPFTFKVQGILISFASRLIDPKL